MTSDEVFVIIRDAITTVLEVDPSTVRRDTSLVTDLNADSLALVEVVEIVEERLGVHIDDDDIEDLQTVGDAVDYAVSRL
jgi:acyl carrier protein